MSCPIGARVAARILCATWVGLLTVGSASGQGPGMRRGPLTASQSPAAPLPTSPSASVAEPGPPLMLHLVGQWGGAARALAADEHRLWVAIGLRLVVVSIADPDQPQLEMMSEVLPAPPVALALDGDAAYAACGDAGLVTLGPNPSGQLVIRNRIAARAVDVVVAGRAVVVAGDGLWVATGRWLPQPEVITQVDVAPRWSLAAAGSVVYALGNDLVFVDVSEPASPKKLGALPINLAVSASDVSVLANRLYVGAETQACWDHYDYGRVCVPVGWLWILDVSQPEAPVGQATLELASSARIVQAVNDNLIVAGTGRRNIGLSRPVLEPVVCIFRIAGYAAELLSCSTLPEQAADLLVVGDRVYAAVGSSGVHAYDVTYPAVPRRLEPLHLPAPVTAVTERDGIAFAGAGTLGLRVVDMRDAGNPAELGLVPAPPVEPWQSPLVQDVEQFGDFVLTAETNSLSIVDISDPASPVRRGLLRLPGVVDIATEGSSAYVASQEHMVTADLSDPASPVITAKLRFGAFITALDADNDWVYVAADRFHVLSRADPGRPSPIGGLGADSYVSDLDFAGSRLYAASRESGLWLVDLADEDRWRVAGRAALRAFAVAAMGQLAVVVTSSSDEDIVQPQFRVYETNDAGSPRELFQSGPLRDTAPAVDVEAAAGYAYVAAGDLYVVELTALSGGTPRTSQFRFGSDVAALYATAETLFVATRDGVYLLDLTVPGAVRPRAFIPVPGADATAATARHLYVVDGESQVRAYELSDARRFESLVELSRLYRAPRLLAAAGQLLLAAPCGGGFCLLDVAAPGQERRIRGVPMEGAIGALELNGDRAYAAGLMGIQAFDVSDPDAPRELGVAASRVAVSRLRADGSTVYAAGSNGSQAFDVSDAVHPHPIHPESLWFAADDIQIAGRIAYVARGPDGVTVYDLSQPANPRQLASYDTSGTALRLWLDGTRIFVADGDGGLLALDVMPAVGRVYLPAASRGAYALPGS